MRLHEEINNKTNSENILNSYIENIFDAEIWINKEVYKIAEVTYSYKSEFESKNLSYNKGYHFNTTLFSSIGGLDYKDFVNSKEKDLLLTKAGENANNTIKGKIIEITKIIKKINNLKYFSLESQNKQTEINNKEIFEIKKELSIKSLIYNKKLLNQAILGLPFELEKAGLKHNLSNNEINQRIEKIDEIDLDLFGGNIKDNPKELINAYERLRTKLEQAGKVELFQKELQEIEKLLPIGYKFKTLTSPKSVCLKQIDIDNNRDTFVKILNTYNQSQNIDYPVELDEKVGSITDEIEKLKIPVNKNNEFYKSIITIKRIAHEIDAHTINLKNGEKLIGNIRGAKNLIKEEGLAMLLEFLFEYGENIYITRQNNKKEIDINKIDLTQYFPKYLLAEILDSSEIINFVQKYNEIENDSTTPVNRLLRMKRNRPLNSKGHQCKDMTYIRGMIQTAKYINSGKSPINLFFGKVGFEDIDALARIKELYEQNGVQLDLIEPIMMYEQIYFKLLQKYSGNDFKNISFLNYLKNKYPLFNFSKEQIKSTKKETKYQIAQILNLLKTNIEISKFAETRIHQELKTKAQIKNKKLENKIQKIKQY